MDGVLANFGAAYREYEARLFGPAATPTRAGNPEDQRPDPEVVADPVRDPEAARPVPHPSELRRRRDVVWQAIEDTPEFWTLLKPMDPTAVARMHALMLRHRWDVFFITQRPPTRGETVQRQTQRWLVAQGFELPSVLMIPGLRGDAAGALKLDYHVDDSPRNCIDVKAHSHARPLLVVDATDEVSVAAARKLGIGTAAGISESLDILEQASLAITQPSLLDRLAKLVGWQSD
jgi:hypothetical protein